MSEKAQSDGGQTGEQKPALTGRRALQAAQTRRDILTAARRRFAEHGYGATSLKEIAADAGVSIQTIYDSVGNKTEMVLQLSDLIDEETQMGELVAPVFSTTDPNVVLRTPARVTRRLVERCGDIVRAGLAGSHTDSELTPMVEEGGRRHRAGATMVASRLLALGALRKGLGAEAAAITIATIADFRIALVLIDDHGFTLDQVEDWIADTLTRAVLKP